MKTIKAQSTNYGPTNHSGGNSLANASDLAWANAKRIAASVSVGDEIDATELDDMTLDELRKELRTRGLRLDGAIVSAPPNR